MKKPYLILFSICTSLICMLLASCASVEKYRYFSDISDTAQVAHLKIVGYQEPKIDIGDGIYVVIQSIDPTIPVPANSASILPGANAISLPTTGSQMMTTGYFVDKEGNLNLPVIGGVRAKGLTIGELQESISKKALELYRQSNVIVRYLNFKFTLLGEVNRPGSYNTPNEKISILDALGYGGDLTIYGRRDNVTLFRKNDKDELIAYRINLNKTQFMQAPFFYLKQNDVLYVEPLQTKVTASDASQSRNLSIISLSVTVLALLLSRIK